MIRRRAAPPAVIERSLQIGRPLDEVVAAFRGDPETTPEDVELVVDEPDLLTWELARRGLRGSRLSLVFEAVGDATLVTSRFQPRLGGLRIRLRRHALTRRYEEIVERVLEATRQELEPEFEEGDGEGADEGADAPGGGADGAERPTSDEPDARGYAGRG